MIDIIIQCIATGVVVGGVLGAGALIYSCFNKNRMQKNGEMVEHLLQDQRVTKVQVGDFVVERDSPEKPLLEICPTASSPKSGTAALTDSSHHTTATDIQSPIEQFDVISGININLVDLYFSFTNSSLFMPLTLTLGILLLFHFFSFSFQSKKE